MEKPQIIVLNKMDIPGTEQAAEVFREAVQGRPVMLISAAARQGIEDLKYRLVELLDKPKPRFIGEMNIEY
jgi:GTP-binding protein